MKQEVIIIDPKEFGIDKVEAKALQKGLPSIIKAREAFEEQYEQVIRMEITPETSKIARELRIKIRDNRTKELMPWHKTTKEYHLAASRFIDAVKNKQVRENERMEENLEKIEKAEQIARDKELDARLETRLELLKTVDPEDTHHGMRDLTDDVFDAYYSALTARKEKAQEAAARLVEEEMEMVRLAGLYNERRTAIALFGFEELLSRLTETTDEDTYQSIINDCETLRKEREESQQAKANELQAKIDAEEAERLERATIQHQYLTHKSVGFTIHEISGDYIKESYSISQNILGTISNDEIKSMASEINSRIIKDLEQDRIAAELKEKKAEENRLAKERAEKVDADNKKGDTDRWADMTRDIELIKKRYDGKMTDAKKLKQVGELLDKVIKFIGA